MLICDEAREVLRKQKEKEQQREASHAPQIIPAKEDPSMQRLEKEKAVLQAAYDQLLRRLNDQKKHGEQNQPDKTMTCGDAKQQSSDSSSTKKEKHDEDGTSLFGLNCAEFSGAVALFMTMGDVGALARCSKEVNAFVKRAILENDDDGPWRLMAKRDYPYLFELIKRVRASNGNGEADEDRAADMSTWLAVARWMPSASGGCHVFVPLPPPSSNARLMYRRERVLEGNGEKPIICRYGMGAPPKPLSSYCLHLKFHLEQDGRKVAVVSKFVEEMVFGLRKDQTNGDAIRFTLDVYPELRKYEYDSVEISCDLVQRLSNKRCPLFSRGKMEIGGRTGEYYVGWGANNVVDFRVGHVDPEMYIWTSQGKCPCSCGGWVGDPDNAKDANSSMFQNFGLMQTLCTCDWAREEWKDFRLFDFELFFEGYEIESGDREEFTAQQQLEKMNQYEFI